MARLQRTAAWAEERGRDRGLHGPSGAWLAAWVLGFSYRHLRKRLAARPVVVREELRPGEQLVITHFERGAESQSSPPRRGRRSRRS